MVTDLGIIVQARMNSSRLPGKVLTNINNNKLLAILIENLKRVKFKNKIVIATSKNSEDDKIEEFCQNNEVNIFRGDSENVLLRYVECCDFYGFKNVIRVTADNPFTDPDGIDEIIKIANFTDADLVDNIHKYGYPKGFGSEFIKAEALTNSLINTKDNSELEHVTLHIKNNPHKYKITRLYASSKICRTNYFFTCDYNEDLTFLRTLVSQLPKQEKTTMLEIIDYCDKNPELMLINNHKHEPLPAF